MSVEPIKIHQWLRDMPSTKMVEMCGRISKKTCDSDLVLTARKNLMTDILQNVMTNKEWISPDSVGFEPLARHALTPMTNAVTPASEHVKKLAEFIEAEYSEEHGLLKADEPSDEPKIAAPEYNSSAPKGMSEAVAEEPDPQTQHRSKKMDGKPTYKDEMTEAMYLVAANKITDAFKAAVVGAATRGLPPGEETNAIRGKVAMFLDTPAGKGVLGFALAGILGGGSSLLGEKLGASAEKLDFMAGRLRVNAYVNGGNALADELLDPLIAVGADFIKNAGLADLPDVPKAAPALPEKTTHHTVETVGQKVPVAVGAR